MAMRGFRFPAVNSQKVCDVCWANVQGLKANIEHYRNSPIMERYRPFLFDSCGRRIPFPEPDPGVLDSAALRDSDSYKRSALSRGPDSNKLFIGGLSRNATDDGIRKYFKKFAPVKEAAIVIDRTSGKSRGFGFCLFTREVPWAAISAACPHIIDGVEVAVKKYSACKENKNDDYQVFYPSREDISSCFWNGLFAPTLLTLQTL